jgi:hypothetical protein
MRRSEPRTCIGLRAEPGAGLTVLTILSVTTLSDMGTWFRIAFGLRGDLCPARQYRISKLSGEDNEAGELHKAEEVLSVEFPADEYTALPLYPGEETLDEPASHIVAQPSSILRRREK